MSWGKSSAEVMEDEINECEYAEKIEKECEVAEVDAEERGDGAHRLITALLIQ